MRQNYKNIFFGNKLMLWTLLVICLIMHVTFPPICSSARVRQGRQEWTSMCVMIPCWGGNKMGSNVRDGFTLATFAGLSTLIRVLILSKLFCKVCYCNMLVFYCNHWHADSSTIITDNQFQKKLIQTIQIFREIIFRKDAFKLFYINTKALYVKQMLFFWTFYSSKNPENRQFSGFNIDILLKHQISILE